MKDKIIGSIIGFAIGDALGMALEFEKDTRSISTFQPNNKKGLKAGQYTDDTQHLEISIDSLITHKGKVDLDDIAKRLIIWYTSKDARSMGRTTELAIRNLLAGVSPRESGIDNYQSCGSLGIVRLIPYSLLSSIRPNEKRITNGNIKNVLGVTHAHKDVYHMGLLLDFVIHEISGGKSLQETVDLIITEKSFLNKALRNKLKHVTELAESDIPPYDAILEIGNSGYVRDVVLSAIYSTLRYSNFREAILCSANGRGDSDSRAAITGALMGLQMGLRNIPQEWISDLERSSVLKNKASELYTLSLV